MESLPSIAVKLDQDGPTVGKRSEDRVEALPSVSSPRNWISSGLIQSDLGAIALDVSGADLSVDGVFIPALQGCSCKGQIDFIWILILEP